MNIFTEINTSWTKMQKHLFKRHNLLLRFVAAVVDENINSGNPFLEGFPEAAILLISYENLRAFIRITFGGFLYVHTIDATLRTEVIPPHFEAPTAVYTYLKHMNIGPDKLTEMTMVNVKNTWAHFQIPLPVWWQSKNVFKGF